MCHNTLTLPRVLTDLRYVERVSDVLKICPDTLVLITQSLILSTVTRSGARISVSQRTIVANDEEVIVPNRWLHRGAIIWVVLGSWYLGRLVGLVDRQIGLGVPGTATLQSVVLVSRVPPPGLAGDYVCGNSAERNT